MPGARRVGSPGGGKIVDVGEVGPGGGSSGSDGPRPECAPLDTDGRVEDPAPEVRSPAAAFNCTAARLAHLLDAQRAFASEASHQLKTPLAAPRLRLENLEPSVSARDRGSLTAAVTDTDRPARMVEGLLAMARLEEHAAMRGLVDVGEVCAERHRTWLPLYGRQGVSLVLFAGSGGPVLALPGAVEQILDNLLSNALRASPADSTVTVELRPYAPPRPPPRLGGPARHRRGTRHDGRPTRPRLRPVLARTGRSQRRGGLRQLSR